MTEEEELRRHRVCRRRSATIACRKNRSAPCCRRDRVSGRRAPCVVVPPLPRIFQNTYTSHHTHHAPSRSPRPRRIRPSTTDYIAFSSPPPTKRCIERARACAEWPNTHAYKAIGANTAAAVETSAAVAPQRPVRFKNRPRESATGGPATQFWRLGARADTRHARRRPLCPPPTHSCGRVFSGGRTTAVASVAVSCSIVQQL